MTGLVCFWADRVFPTRISARSDHDRHDSFFGCGVSISDAGSLANSWLTIAKRGEVFTGVILVA